MKRGRFSEENYDLIRCNSNHFCRDAMSFGLKLQISIPEWIFTVPLFFPLSCNIGQFLHPLMYKSSDSCLAPRTTEESYHNSTIKNMSSFVAFMTDSNKSPIEENPDYSTTSDSCVSSISNTNFTHSTDNNKYNRKSSTSRENGVRFKQPPAIEIVWKDSSEKLRLTGNSGLDMPTDRKANDMIVEGVPQFVEAENRNDSVSHGAGIDSGMPKYIDKNFSQGNCSSLEDGNFSLKVQIQDFSLDGSLTNTSNNQDEEANNSEARKLMRTMQIAKKNDLLDNAANSSQNFDDTDSQKGRWRNMKGYIRSKFYDTGSLITDSSHASSSKAASKSGAADGRKGTNVANSDKEGIGNDVNSLQIDDKSYSHPGDAVKLSQNRLTARSETESRCGSVDTRDSAACKSISNTSTPNTSSRKGKFTRGVLTKPNKNNPNTSSLIQINKNVMGKEEISNHYLNDKRKATDAKIEDKLGPRDANLDENKVHASNKTVYSGKNADDSDSQQRRWRSMKGYIRSRYHETSSLNADNSHTSSSKAPSKIVADEKVLVGNDVSSSQIDDKSYSNPSDDAKLSQSHVTVRSETGSRCGSLDSRESVTRKSDSTTAIQNNDKERKTSRSPKKGKIRGAMLTQPDTNNTNASNRSQLGKNEIGNADNSNANADDKQNSCDVNLKDKFDPGFANVDEKGHMKLIILAKTESTCSTSKASSVKNSQEDDSLLKRAIKLSKKLNRSDDDLNSKGSGNSNMALGDILQEPLSADTSKSKISIGYLEGMPNITCQIDYLEQRDINNVKSEGSKHRELSQGTSEAENNDKGKMTSENAIITKDSFSKYFGNRFLENVEDVDLVAPPILQKRNKRNKFRCIDSFECPLISNDSKGIGSCIQRLQSVLKKLKTIDEKTRKKTVLALDHLRARLEAGKTISTSLLPGVCGFLRHCLENGHSTVHALLLLRVIILQSPPSITAPCYDWLTRELTASRYEPPTSKTMEQPVARSLGWLVACNALANTSSINDFRRLIIAANVDMNDTEVPVQLRQAACAFLYNTALIRRVRNNATGQDSLWTSYVSITNACLNGLKEETDSTARLRRIMILSRILRPKDVLTGGITSNENARDLFLSLGAKDIFFSVQTQLKNSTEDEAVTCTKGLYELIQIMEKA